MPVTAKDTAAAIDDAVDDAADHAADETRDFADRVSDGVSNAADFVSDGVKSISAQMPRIGEWFDDQLARVTDAARTRPVQTIAITAGIAALVGALIARR